MMLQAYACAWSLNVPSPLCHGIKADHHQPQILLNPGCTSSRGTWFLGSHYGVLMGRLRAAHTSPVSAEGADGPQHTDFNHCSSLEGHIPDSDSMYWSMFSYEHVGQIPLQTAWGPRAFVSTGIQPHTVRQTTLALNKKWISHFRSNPSPKLFPYFCFENCIYCYHLIFFRA